jgi:hypothetical protein
MSFNRPGIFGATGLFYALTVDLDYFSIFTELLVTGQVSFCSQLVNYLSTTMLLVFVYIYSLTLPVA